MDIFSKEKRSKVMSRIHSRDTRPELLVRHYLWSRGYRYRKNVRSLPGSPDVVLRKYRVAIFVHGCFWHGHEVDGRLPRSHTEFWRNKIEANRRRDQRCKQQLRERGWTVITVWECQLKPAVRRRTLAELEWAINHCYLSRFRVCGESVPTSVPVALPAHAASSDENASIVAEPTVAYGKKRQS